MGYLQAVAFAGTICHGDRNMKEQSVVPMSSRVVHRGLEVVSCCERVEEHCLRALKGELEE
jgi:hypothetical protein